MNQQSRLGSVVNSKFYPLLLFLVSFVFVMLFSRATSFLYVFEGSDPSVFKQMGRAILKGKMMYIDYFDNKGCLLYFIHALGLWLGGDTAILLMQVVSLTVTLFIWDKILALYRTEKGRVIGLCIALLLLLCFYGAGDQTQEWCLPFISYPLLVFMRAYKSKTEIGPRQMFFIGICFGIITFIQINNACAFLGFVAWLWVQWLAKKDFKNLFQSIGCFIAGWIIIALPCLLYFYVKAGWHSVYEMAYASFWSNFEYIDADFSRRAFFVIPYALFLLAFTALMVVSCHKNKDMLIPLSISIILFVVTFGKLCNMYYLMAFLPLCIVAMATFDFQKQRKTQYGLCGVLALCVAYYACNPVLHFVEDLVLQNEKEVTIYHDFHHCISVIPENERDSIYNYNLHSPATSMMEHEGLLQCNRVLFTSLAFSLPTLWKEETSKPFIPPKWILLSFDKKYEKEDVYYILEAYDMACSFHYDKLYFHTPHVGDEFDVYLYRRKD